jgi:curved DNA-binding protein CbpA
LNADGSYVAGLHLTAPSEPGSASSEANHPKKDPDSVPDYYEVLQVNSKADPDMIHRVYRLLAQRFHPDNPETGNQDAFRKLLEAYRVLSDPEQRASYDIKHGSQNQLRWRIFDQSNALSGRVTEQRKREGILSILYTRRVNEPAQPAMNLMEMEDLLGCPREHLEFSLWFLKEKGFVVKSDNGRFAITVAGAEEAERDEIPWAREDRLLSTAAD